MGVAVATDVGMAAVDCQYGLGGTNPLRAYLKFLPLVLFPKALAEIHQTC